LKPSHVSHVSHTGLGYIGSNSRTSDGLPKILMQTWITETMSDVWNQCRQSIQNNLPSDWSYVFLTDSAMISFVENEYPRLLECFLNMPHGVQRADILRYLWLYKYGGIYMDTDYKVLKPFFHIFDKYNVPLYVIHSANTNFVYTNSFIAAKPNLKFFYDLALYALRHPLGSWWSFTKHTDIMSSSGPLAFNNFVRSSNETYAILPNDFFHPYSSVLYDNVEIGDSFMIAVKGESWNSIDSQILNFLNKSKYFVILLFILMILNLIIDRFIFSNSLYTLVKKIQRALKDKKNVIHKINDVLTNL